MSRQAVRVLLIEADPGQARKVRESLPITDQGGFELREVDRLDAALDQLDASEFDAVLLDVAIPDCPGIEAIRRARDWAPAAPIVALTKNGGGPPAAEVVRAGANDYVSTERIDADVLVRSIRLAVERRRAEEALRTASRLDVTATLVGGIAHQFNNLLCSVIGNAELLKLQLDDQPAALGNLAAVIEAAKKASELARQLHGLAQTAGGERQEVSLNAAVEQALQLGATGRNHAVEIVRELAPNLWTVRARTDRMTHLAVNVCRNAVEAVEAAGRVHISTRNVVLDEAAASRLGVAPGPYAALRVADTGRGMDPETMSHVFEPFFSTKPRGKGLGMPAVQEIVAEYHGGIAVDSEPGLGTRVEVFLPASEAAVPADYREAEAAKDHSGARTVLVIDDEEMILRLTRRLLEGLGHTVLTAQSGAEAVEIASSRPEPIDIALLDLNLPGVDSTALYQSLVDARPQMKVIICSGELGSSAEPLLQAGAASFLSKPFRLDALEREVGRAV